jgi:nitrite reductase (NADH) large subunit
MSKLVAGYRCEWKEVVESPELRERFRHFAASAEPDASLSFVRERGQRRPADWAEPAPIELRTDVPGEAAWEWKQVARVDEVPSDGGATIRHGNVQIAVFHFARRGTWHATQAMCPHRKDNVLARGLLGDQAGEPKVACPLHKRTFSLQSGKGLSDPTYQVRTFPVEVRGDEIWLKLPPEGALDAELACPRHAP